MTPDELRATVERTCQLCGHPELATKVRVAWSRRFTARMGDARWDKVRGVGVVRLSLPLWPKATKAERLETVVHEICHLIADATFGRPQGHGPTWRMMMARCGYPEAKRCHAVDREAIAQRRRQQRVRAACGCPEGVQLGPVQARRLRAGAVYLCRRCGRAVQLPPT